MCVDETMHATLSNLSAAGVGVSTPIALALAGFGLILWLTGAAWSRSLVTLILVAMGTWIGMRLPEWCGWHIDGMATAFGGAIALGAAGYVLHRWWIGLAVGWTCALIALAIASSVWIVSHGGLGQQASAMPHLDAPREKVSVMADDTLSAVERVEGIGNAALSENHSANGLWELLGQVIRIPMVQFVLGAGIAGFLVGLMIAVRWPRLSASLVWSDIGLSLAGTMGSAAIIRTHPDWLQRLPRPTVTMAMTPLALFVIGAGIQFYLAGRAAGQIPANVSDAEE
jgi:hypothetical protein